MGATKEIDREREQKSDQFPLMFVFWKQRLVWGGFLTNEDAIGPWWNCNGKPSFPLWFFQVFGSFRWDKLIVYQHWGVRVTPARELRLWPDSELRRCTLVDSTKILVLERKKACKKLFSEYGITIVPEEKETVWFNKTCNQTWWLQWK